MSKAQELARTARRLARERLGGPVVLVGLVPENEAPRHSGWAGVNCGGRIAVFERVKPKP